MRAVKRHDILRQRLGQSSIHGGPHHRAVGDGAQRFGRVLTMVTPGARVGDAELHRRIDRDEIPTIAEEQGVLVGGMLHAPRGRSQGRLPSSPSWPTVRACTLPHWDAKHTIHRPRPMQMQPRRERLASNRHTQTLDQTLLLHPHHRQGRGKPAQQSTAR